MKTDSAMWSNLSSVVCRSSPFGNETGKLPMGVFEPKTTDTLSVLSQTKVLVIGAGGLGCEILKDLALSGFRDITVIDLDTIDLSNLNRQFLFRKKDVGRSKAEVASEFINNRVKGCNVKWFMDKIQSFDELFYRQFRIIVCGLDNLEARRWLNAKIVSMVDHDEDGEINPDTVIPLIDGGTEGLRGQARVIIPKITACFECTIADFPPQLTFQICTIGTNKVHTISVLSLFHHHIETDQTQYEHENNS